MSIAFLKTTDGFTAVVQNKPYSIRTSHENYEVLFKAVADNDEQRFLDNLTPDAKLARVINNSPVFIKNEVKFVDGEVTYKAIPLAGIEVERIKQYAKEKIPFQRLLRWVENRMENPSPEALSQLYPYIEKHELPITEDGCFLAYKSVRQDWKDKYSGRISNHVGAKPNMKREDVDADTNVHCSQGLHVGALAYSGPEGWYHNAGDRVVICKVNPKDVISVPNDHNGQKMRVCEYEVVGEYVCPLNPLRNDDYESDDNDYEDDIQAEYDDDFADEDDDLDDVISREKISAYSIEVDDYVEFNYNDKPRFMHVENVNLDTVEGTLYVNNHDLWSKVQDLTDEDGCDVYRTFKLERMRGVYRVS